MARQGRGQRGRRLRLPHDHERRQRRHARRDGPARRRGRPRLQAVHRLPGRLLQRRRGDLPGDAADGDERRADHDARRERDGDRRRRGRRGRRGPHRPLLPRGRPLPDLRGRGDEPGDPPGRGGRRAGLHRPPLGARRARTPCATARDRGALAFAETCPQYLFLSLDDMGNGFEGAKFVCSPPLRPADHQAELWTGLVKDDLQVVSTDHCPFDFHGQKELGRGDFRKIPNGLPGVEDRVDLLHDGGVIGGRISRERWVEVISTAPARMFGMYPRKGSIAVGADADLVVYDPNARAHDQRQDPPHGGRLLVLRGPDRPGPLRRRPVARLGRSSATASSPAERATAGSSSAGPPTMSAGPDARRPPRRFARRVENAGERRSALRRDFRCGPRPVLGVERFEAPWPLVSRPTAAMRSAPQAGSTPRPGNKRSASSISRGGLAGASFTWTIASRLIGKLSSVAAPLACQWQESRTSSTPGRPATTRPGQRRRVDRAVGEPEELEGHPDPVPRRRVAGLGEPSAHRVDRPVAVDAGGTRRNDQEVGGAEAAADLQPGRSSAARRASSSAPAASTWSWIPFRLQTSPGRTAAAAAASSAGASSSRSARTSTPA